MSSSQNKPLRILRGSSGDDDTPEGPSTRGTRSRAPAPRDMTDAVEPMVSEEPANDARELSPREEIERIKKENLTGRQLRIARRMAQRHNLAPTSDLDAVRLLRRIGIDPFEKKEIMDVIGPKNPAPGEEEPPKPVALPATVRKSPVGDHRPPVIDDNTREQEVRKIQRDLVKRRRKRLGLLLIKLACYVMLPSLIAGYYFYRVATPMYATYSEFVIQSADAPGTAGASGLFANSPFANTTDSITVQGYLSSRDAMLRLDENPGFREYFQGENVDVLQRLDDDATNEEAYKVYKKRVVIGFDPTEGIIKLEVIAPSPEVSRQISEALIGYAEGQVDQLTERLRQDQMAGAEDAYAEAELKMELALDRVAELQRQSDTLDAQAEASLLMGQIGELESQVTQKQLELAQLEDNLRPNRTKLRVLQREIEILNAKIDEKRNQVGQGTSDNRSVVDISAELRKAETNLALRQQLLGQALQNLESARTEANRQTRYLSMGVSPVTPDQATYPRAFENTLLAVVIFAGIYLMISLTASILREQVTT